MSADVQSAAETQPKGGVRVEFTDMQKLYLAAQRMYRRPAFSLLSDSQLRHYVPEVANWKHRADIRGMFEVLTSRDTRPEYYDTIKASYQRSAEVRDMHTQPMKEKELMGKVDDEIFTNIELKERERKDALRLRARVRREERKKEKAEREGGACPDLSH